MQNYVTLTWALRDGVAQSVQCLTTDWTAGVRSPTEAEDVSSNLCVQTGSGAHPASCTVGTGGSFPGGKARPGRDADHSSPSSAEVKKEWELYLLSPRCASMERNGTTLLNAGGTHSYHYLLKVLSVITRNAYAIWKCNYFHDKTLSKYSCYN
jgi:hypothetical protein